MQEQLVHISPITAQRNNGDMNSDLTIDLPQMVGGYGNAVYVELQCHRCVIPEPLPNIRPTNNLLQITVNSITYNVYIDEGRYDKTILGEVLQRGLDEYEVPVKCAYNPVKNALQFTSNYTISIDCSSCTINRVIGLPDTGVLEGTNQFYYNLQTVTTYYTLQLPNYVADEYGGIYFNVLSFQLANFSSVQSQQNLLFVASTTGQSFEFSDGPKISIPPLNLNNIRFYITDDAGDPVDFKGQNWEVELIVRTQLPQQPVVTDVNGLDLYQLIGLLNDKTQNARKRLASMIDTSNIVTPEN